MKKLKRETIKEIKNLFQLENENKATEDIILRYIRNSFENEEEKIYYKPARVDKFWTKNYIEYKINDDRNKKISWRISQKISLYLKDIINTLKNSDTWKIQLAISNTFIFSIDNDEEGVMRSKSDNK